MTPEFTQQLTAFRNYAWAVSREFGQLIDDTVASVIPPGMGLVATDVGTQVTVADKIGDVVDSIAKTYLNTIGAYYETKGKIVQLKAAAKGGVAVQAQQSISAASTAFQKNPIPWIAGAGLLVYLLTRK